MGCTVFQKARVGFGLGLVVLGCLGLLLGHGTNQLIQSADGSARLRQVDDVLEAITRSLAEAEVARCHYLLTGTDGALGRCHTAEANAQATMPELGQLIGDNTEQRQRLDLLHQAAHRYWDLLRQSTAVRKQQGLILAAQAPATEDGYRLEAEVRRIAAAISGDERAAFYQRQDRSRWTAWLTLRALDVGNILSLMVFLVSLGLIRQDLRTQQKAAPEQRSLAAELAERTAELGDAQARADAHAGQLHQLEIQLRHSQMSAALGEMTRAIAHDFNNLLAIVLNCSAVLRQAVVPRDAADQLMQNIEGAGLRAADLCRQLLAFGRAPPTVPGALDVNTVVSDFQTLLNRLLPSNVELTTALEPGLSLVQAERGQVEQLLLNLVVNARDALRKGGRICIETRHASPQARQTDGQCPTNAPCHYALIAVSDTGDGIAPEVRARLFEPYFTTKGPHKGTGLGLATVARIVQQSAGCIAVDSELGRGTTFRVYLPLANQIAPLPLAAGPTLAPSRGCRETILVVEDEPIIRNWMQTVLAGQGYEVLTAGDGEEALGIARRHELAIQLLVTDIALPGASGPELAGQLVVGRPRMRVLYVSGSPSAPGLPLPAGAAFLQKPVSGDSLGRKVREMLARRGAESQG